MTKFKREKISLNGNDVVMLTAGSGEPLVFFHGAGTMSGFDFALPWAEKFKVMIPYHLGFGESGDDLSISDMHDYVMHYMDLFDQLDLDQVNLVGFSMGGWMAARFATEYGYRLKRLVLVAPAGLRVPEHPTVDIFKLKPEELVASLVHNIDVLTPFLPDGHDVDFIVERYRESSSFARIAWERMYDPKLSRYLHRLNMPTMVLWGKEDRIVPVQQADIWSGFIPGSKVHVVAEAGHLVLDEQSAAVSAVADFLA